MVPTLTCGFVRTKFSFATSLAQLPVTNGFLRIRHEPTRLFDMDSRASWHVTGNLNRDRRRHDRQHTGSCCWDLNPGPRPYQGRTLPAELQQQRVFDFRPLALSFEAEDRKLITDDSQRVKGIEPSPPAWKAGALPLSYTRRGELFGSQHPVAGQGNLGGPFDWPGGRLEQIVLVSLRRSHFWLRAGSRRRVASVGRTGFEPVKAEPPDLQSGPVGRLGISPIFPTGRFTRIFPFRTGRFEPLVSNRNTVSAPPGPAELALPQVQFSSELAEGFEPTTACLQNEELCR